MSRDEAERDAGLWVADEHDEEGLADPLAGIMARRSPAGALNPDLGDAVAALIALAAYVGKQLSLRADLRRARRAGLLPAAAEQPEQPAEPAYPTPAGMAAAQ